MNSQPKTILRTNLLKEVIVWSTVILLSFSQIHIEAVSADETQIPGEVVQTEAPVTESVPSEPEAVVEEIQPVVEAETQLVDEPSIDTGVVIVPDSQEDALIATGVEEQTPTEDVVDVLAGINNSGSQLAGGTIGAGDNMMVVTGNQHILPAKTIWVQDGVIMIDDQESNATLKKDNQFQLKEIEMQETATVTGSIGVTVIIPQDTKIFSPENVVTTGESAPVVETPAIIQEPAIQPTPVLPQEVIGTDTGLIGELISSSFVDSLDAPVSDSGVLTEVTSDPFVGQATLQSDTLIIEDNNDPLLSQSGWDNEKTFTFGIADQHLVFTKPVEIHVAMTELPDGTPIMLGVKHAGDTEFGHQGISNDTNATCDDRGNISAESDMSVVQSGEVVFYTCGASDFTIGVVNSTFNPNFNGIISGMAMQSNGSIIIGGAFTTGGANINVQRLSRVTNTGIIDSSFAPQISGGAVHAIVVDTGDNVIIAGAFTTGATSFTMNRIAKITSTGLFLTGLQFTGNINSTVNALAIDTGLNIYVGGLFTTVNTVTRNRFARVSVTGLLDTTFTGNVNNTVNAITIQSPGLTLIGGMFTGVNSTMTTGIARVTTTGLRDMTFTGNVIGGTVNVIAIDGSGNIIIGGTFTGVNGTLRNNLARLTTTGLLDTTFNPNVNSGVNTIKILPDRRIIIGGVFTMVGATTMKNRVAIINPDGSYDPTFDAAVDNAVLALVVDPAAVNLYIGGAFLNVNAINRFRFAKIGLVSNSVCLDPGVLSVGGLDAVFNPSVSGIVTTMGVQYSNCIVVGGSFSGVGGINRNNLARVTTTGLLDTSFDPNMNGAINALMVDSGNNMVIGGAFTSGGANVLRNRIARVTNTGLIDTTFTGNMNNVVNALAVDHLGRVIVGGAFTGVQGVQMTGLARVTTTGLVDRLFSGTTNNTVTAVTIDSGGNILIGGLFTGVNGTLMTGLARLTTTGLVDPLFTGNVNNVISTIIVQPNGSIIIGGSFTGVNGTQVTGLARVSANGTLDSFFTPNLNGGVSGFILFPDGRIAVGGSFTTVGGASQPYLAVLSAVGVLDTSLSPTIDNITDIHSLDQSNYSFYLGGPFTTINGTTRNGLARLGLVLTGFTCGTAPSASIGTVDGLFNPNMNNAVNALGVQSNGCLILGGAFTTGGANINVQRLARVSATGLIDPNFIPVISGGAVNAVAVDSGDNIYLGGAFLTGGAFAMVRIAKVSSTGVVFTGMAFTGNVNGAVNALAVTASGTVIVGGAFTTINGGTANRIARIRPDGLIDTAFTGNMNNVVNAVAIQSDGKILVGGLFTGVQTALLTGLARVTTTGLVDRTFTGTLNSGYVNAIAIDGSGSIVFGGVFTGVNGTLVRNIARVTTTGLLDTTFLPVINSGVNTIKILSDGRIVVGGTFTFIGGVMKNRVAILNADGTLDATFDASADSAVLSVVTSNTAGSMYLAGAYSNINAIVRPRMVNIGLTATSICLNTASVSLAPLDSVFNPNVNGMVSALSMHYTNCLLVGGSFTSVGGTARNNLARVTTTGLLDTTFDPNMNDLVNALVVDSGNNVVIGGAFTTGGANIVQKRLARVTTTGLIDTAFTGNINNVVNALAIDTGGRVIVGGVFTGVQGVQITGLARVTTTGLLDTTFTGVIDGVVNALSIDTGGRIVFGGSFTSVGGTLRNNLARVTTTGLLDLLFTGDVDNTVTTVDIDTGGNIVIGGAFTSINDVVMTGLARLTTTGLVDPTFNANLSGGVSGATILPNGKIIVGGSFLTVSGMVQSYVALLTNTGLLDTTVNPVLNNPANTFVVDASNSSAYLGGSFTTINGTTRNYLAKIGLTDPWFTCGTAPSAAMGTLTATFNPNMNNAVNALGMQSNGCLVLGGAFTTGGANINVQRLARVSATGIIDPGFIPQISGGVVNAVAFDSGDAIYIGGAFTTGGAGFGMNRIAKITSSGLFLTGLQFTGNANNTVNALAVTIDGKIIVGGLFTALNGVTSKRIARIRPDGLIDTTFTGNMNNTVNALAIQSDGKILVGGLFTGVQGVFFTGLARVTTTGLIDATFTGTITSGMVNAIAIDGSGNIVFGGIFTGVNGTLRNNLARVSTTGLLDTTFNPNVNSGVNSIDILPDGRIIVGGTFTQIGSTMKNRIAVLNADGTLDMTFDNAADSAVLAIVASNAVGSVYIGGVFNNINTTIRPRIANIGLVTTSICLSAPSTSLGTLDSVFNPNVNGMVSALSMHYTNCLIVGGSFTGVGATTRDNLARVTTTGLIDTTFNPDLNDAVNAIVVDSGNNVVIAGAFTTGGANAVRRRVARVTSTGLLDVTFTGNVNNTVDTIAIDQQGKIVIGGLFTGVQGVQSTGIVRLTTTGLLDTTFVGFTDGEVNAVAIDTGGSVVAGGSFASANGSAATNIVRFMTNGVVDSTFTASVNNTITTVDIDTGGKIVIGGAFTGVNGTVITGLARVTITGLLDTTFNANLSGGVSGATILSNGKIVVGGSFLTVSGIVQSYTALLTTTGLLDTTVMPVLNNPANVFVADALNNSFYLGGSFTSINTTTRNHLARITMVDPWFTCGNTVGDVFGNVSATFNPNMNNIINALGVQSNGCLVMGGAFTTGGANLNVQRLARVSATGLFDTTFTPVVSGGAVSALAFDSGDNIYIGGAFTTGGAFAMTRIAKLTYTGLIFTGLFFTGNINGNVNALVVTSGGMIVAGGAFTTVNGITTNRIARLRPDGILDTAFTGNINNAVNTILIDSSGNLIVGGVFTGVNGILTTGLARINGFTGLLDTTFTPNIYGTGMGATGLSHTAILAMAIQSNGSIVVGGMFSGINSDGVTVLNNLARVSVTGLLDTTFTPNINGSVSGVSILPDGRIVIGGGFTTINGLIKSRIAILFPDGSLDTTFDPALLGGVQALALSPSNNAVYVGGSFTLADAFTRNRMLQIGLLPSTCAGLSGCALWLKADAGIIFSGSSRVSGWASQGLRNLTGVQSTGIWQPSYVTGAMNFNPVVRFDGSGQGLTLEGSFYDSDSSQYVVYRTLDFSGTITTTANTTGFAANSCGRAFGVSGGKMSTVLSGERIISGSINDGIPHLTSWKYGTGSPQNISIDGKSYVTGVNWRPGTTGDVGLLIGRAGNACLSGHALSGDIAEIINFSRKLSQAEENQVESYLALKYGITLDQTITGQDYTFPGGVTVWSFLSGGNYNHDIAGIGRNDASSLLQYQSQTVNDSGEIIVQYTGSFSNNQFLTWAHDGLSTTGGFIRGTYANILSGYQRVSRTWKFQEKGTAFGNVLISYYSGSATVNGNATLYMFMNTGGTLLNDAYTTVYTGTLVGNTWQFTVNPSDGSLMTFGYSLTDRTNDFALGALDVNFNPVLSPYGAFMSFIDASGGVVLGGQFTTVGGLSRSGIARLSLEGTTDTIFDPNLAGGGGNNPNDIIQQSNGGFVVGGYFTLAGGIPMTGIARFSVTGLIDSGFNVNLDTYGVYALTLQSDGNILIGGQFTSVSGVTRNHLARITSTGILDTTFNPNVNSVVQTIVVDTGGNIYIGGSFTLVGGVTRNALAKLTSTGLLDTTFNPNLQRGIFGPEVRTLALQPDGNIIVAGGFTGVGVLAKNNIIRVTATGVVDSAFNSDANNIINKITLQQDGTIILGGQFTSIQGIKRERIVRLSSSGLVDTTFDIPISGSTREIDTFAYDSENNSLYIGGLYDSLLGALRTGFGRVGLTPVKCVGIGGCSSWLKADTGVTATTTGLTSAWASQTLYAGLSGVQTTPSLMPKYVTGTMNFNPVIHFTSGNYMTFTSPYFYGYDNSRFMVVRTSATGGVLSVIGNQMNLSANSCDRAVGLTGGAFTAVLSGERVTSSTRVNTNTAQLVSWSYGTGGANGTNVQSLFANHGTGNATGINWFSSVETANGSGMIIGNAGVGCTSGGAYSGDIAEIVTFNRRLSPLETQMVNSYLSLKYGITIDQTIATDYILTGNIVAWNASSGGIYNHDIAGIGRHDTSSLLQYQSQSANNSGDIIVNAILDPSNNDLLTWGNDAANTGGLLSGSAANVLSGFVRTARTWKFQEKNGDMGNIIVSYYTGSFPNITGSTLYLLINTGGSSMSGAATSIYTGLLVGKSWEFTIDPVDGALMTFAYAAANATPTSLSFSSGSMRERIATGELVGTITSTDPDVSDSATYSFDTTCAGTLDNSKFSFSGTNQIKTNHYFTYASQHTGYLCLKVTDGAGASLTGLFEIAILQRGSIGLAAPSALTFPTTFVRSLNTGSAMKTFSGAGESFDVNDLVGDDNGFTATIQLAGDMTGAAGELVSASNLALIGQPAAFYVSGTVNTNVEPVSPTTSPYYTLDTPRDIMWRNSGANGGITSTYGVYLPLSLTVPAGQEPGSYQGTIYFTVIEN